MTNYTLDLINNTFSIEDGETIILNLLNYKIKFINEQIFSQKVRFGEDTTHSESRVKELLEEIKKVKSVIKNIEDPDHQLSLSCKINMDVIKNKQEAISPELAK